MRRRATAAALVAVPLLLGASAPVDRTLRDDAIAENSGFVPGAGGVLWVVQDSGDAPRLHGVDAQGRTVARVRVTGAENRDWEAVAPMTLPGGRRGLVVGDIGDNATRYDGVVLYVVPEPALDARSVRPVATLRLRYPDGQKNAEALLADPRDGRLHVVTKDLGGGTVYAVPPAVWPGGSGGSGSSGEREGVLERVADVTPSLVTDGAVLPDGRIVLRTYGSAFVYPRAEDLPRGRTVRADASATLPRQEQGESVAVVDGGRALLVGSEGRRQPVYRVPVPVPEPEAAAPAPTTGAATEPGTTVTPDVEPVAAQEGTTTTVLGVLAALSALAAGGYVVVTRLRGSRRPRG